MCPLCCCDATCRLQYALQEAVFDKLVITPDLDKRLAAGDADLQHAAAVVESAVASAIGIAFGASRPPTPGSDSDDSSSSSSGAGEFGCTALSSDEQCAVDWDSESLWDNAAAAAAAAAASPALAAGPIDGNLDDAPRAGFSATASVEGLARTAVALDAATREDFSRASAHTFLQRLLYKINRLNHFW